VHANEQALRSAATDWLLEEDDECPTVRYLALRDLLGKPETDADVRAARAAIPATGLVPRMLACMDTDAYRERYPRFYTDKYRGLVWALITLAELCAPPDGRIATACEYLLTHAQEPVDGGFSQHAAAGGAGGRRSEVIPCLTGNLVFAFSRLGYGEDPRVARAADWLARFLRLNDGEETDPQAEPYRRYEMCWGAHTCHMGVVKALKAFAAIPPERRTGEVRAKTDAAADFLLRHHVFRRSHDLGRVSKPGWKRFGFPLMYQTDALEILDILSALGYRDARMREAIALTLDKRDARGCWPLENTYASERLLIPFGEADAPDKWITLRALRVLKRCAQD